MTMEFIEYNENINWGEDGVSCNLFEMHPVRIEKRRKLKQKFKKIYFRLKVNKVLLDLFGKVRYFPGNSGYLECKSNFESFLTR
jgi:hypothetical protein